MTWHKGRELQMKHAKLLRKVGAAVAGGVLALSMVGCGGGGTAESTNSNSSSNDNVEGVELSSQDANASDMAGATSQSLKNLGGTLTVNDVATRPTVQKGTELSDDEASQYDDESRAFDTLPSDSLLKNDAESFYYEDALDGDEAAVYQTLKAVAQDPKNAGKPAHVKSTIDPNSDEFMQIITTALYALTYDHPEFFWTYPSWMESGPTWAYNPKGSGTTSSGKKVWDVYFKLDEPYENYEKEMNKFNDATEDFLKDIDTTKSDHEVARQIHDKLIDTVTYDDDAASRQSDDLAHTAYGALVEDSEGNAHHAVCDGYALAYEYLLQQCGINATVVAGVGGDDESSGNHAWNEVQLDGDWYETDATWDDFGGLEDSAKAQPSNPTAKYVLEALRDKSYRNKIDHYLYNVTTDTMSDFEPTDDYVYDTKDGRYGICLTFPSFHTKADDVSDYNDADKTLMKLAPDAKGTAFANK